MRWPRPHLTGDVVRALQPGARLEVLEPIHRSGRLVVETRNMVLLDVGGKIIKVPKKGSVFMLDSGNVVSGSALIGDPVDRMVRVK